MPIWLKIFILWLLWAIAASCSYVVQLVSPQNRLYNPWVSAVLTGPATMFLLY